MLGVLALLLTAGCEGGREHHHGAYGGAYEGSEHGQGHGGNYDRNPFLGYPNYGGYPDQR